MPILQSTSSPNLLAWSEGRQPLGAVLHSSDQLRELYQWLCFCDDESTINIVWIITIIFIIYFYSIFRPNAAGVKIRLSKNNNHDRVSHGVEYSQQGDRIPPLKSNR